MFRAFRASNFDIVRQQKFSFLGMAKFQLSIWIIRFSIWLRIEVSLKQISKVYKMSHERILRRNTLSTNNINYKLRPSNDIALSNINTNTWHSIQRSTTATPPQFTRNNNLPRKCSLDYFIYTQRLSESSQCTCLCFCVETRSQSVSNYMAGKYLSRHVLIISGYPVARRDGEWERVCVRVSVPTSTTWRFHSRQAFVVWKLYWSCAVSFDSRTRHY